MRTGLIVALLIPSLLTAAEVKLVRRFGEPNPNHEQGWNGHVDHASWVNDDRIVFWSKSGRITCLDVSTGRTAWSLDGIKAVQSWSLSPKFERLAYNERGGGLLGEGKGISIIDCKTGKRLVRLDGARLAKLLNLDHVFPGEIALSPLDGRLILSEFATFYGRNGHIIDTGTGHLESSFDIDAAPREWSLSPDGRYLSLIAAEEVLCVRDLKENRNLFFRGKRILKEPETHTFTIDAPFFSHIRSDGETVIYTQDNSWATGKAFIHDLATKKTSPFDALNGHIELAVHFPSRRIALTGSEARLTLMDFTGNRMADLKNVTLQRNGWIEFSPSGKQILVGSWDNAVYVFDIVE